MYSVWCIGMYCKDEYNIYMHQCDIHTLHNIHILYQMYMYTCTHTIYTLIQTSHNITTGSNIRNELIVNIALISSMTTGAVCIGGVCAVVGTSVCCILEGEGGSESVIGILCFSCPVGIGVGLGIHVVDVGKVILLTGVEMGVDNCIDTGGTGVFSTLVIESVLETTAVTDAESVIIFSDISLTAEKRFDNKPNNKHSQGKVR